MFLNVVTVLLINCVKLLEEPNVSTPLLSTPSVPVVISLSSERKNCPGAIPATASADVAVPCNFSPVTAVLKFRPTLILANTLIAVRGVN